MSVTAEQLAAHFDGLSDEVLLECIGSGTLTELAQRIAETEARKRGLQPVAAPSDPPDEPDAAEEAAPEYETIYRTHNVVEAQVLRGRLEADGIPVLAADYHQNQTDSLLIIAMGGVRIQVPAEYAARARMLLAEVRAGTMAIRDEEVP